MNKIKGTDPSKEQTSQQMCALLVSVDTARFQGSRPKKTKTNWKNQINKPKPIICITLVRKNLMENGSDVYHREFG